MGSREVRAVQAGTRLLTWSLLGLVVLPGVSFLLSDGPPAHFRGAPVQLRPWMHLYNQVVVAAHLLVLIPLTLGAHRWIAATTAATRSLKRVGLGLLLLASAASVGLVLFQATFATDPIAADGMEMRGLRALVFLPPTARSAAMVALVLAFPTPQGQRMRRGVVLAYAVADFAVCTMRWIQTPSVVTATLHPAADQLVLLLPAVGLPLMMLRLLHGGASIPSTSATPAPHD